MIKIEILLHFLSYWLIRSDKCKGVKLFFKNDMPAFKKMRKNWEPLQIYITLILNGADSVALLKLSHVLFLYVTADIPAVPFPPRATRTREGVSVVVWQAPDDGGAPILYYTLLARYVITHLLSLHCKRGI